MGLISFLFGNCWEKPKATAEKSDSGGSHWEAVSTRRFDLLLDKGTEGGDHFTFHPPNFGLHATFDKRTKHVPIAKGLEGLVTWDELCHGCTDMERSVKLQSYRGMSYDSCRGRMLSDEPKAEKFDYMSYLNKKADSSPKLNLTGFNSSMFDEPKADVSWRDSFSYKANQEHWLGGANSYTPVQGMTSEWTSPVLSPRNDYEAYMAPVRRGEQIISDIMARDAAEYASRPAFSENDYMESIRIKVEPLSTPSCLSDHGYRVYDNLGHYMDATGWRPVSFY